MVQGFPLFVSGKLNTMRLRVKFCDNLDTTRRHDLPAPLPIHYFKFTIYYLELLRSASHSHTAGQVSRWALPPTARPM